jgi:nitrite reductase/ring-hydroxylating ferredoxin subunit/ferredoxin-NADP reductase
MLRRLFCGMGKSSSSAAAASSSSSSSSSAAAAAAASDSSLLRSPPEAPVVPGFEALGRPSDLPPLSHYRIAATGADVAIVRLPDGAVRAVHNVCPHKQAQMHLGDIEDATASIICPRHRKKFPGGLHFRLEDGCTFVTQPPQAKFDPAWCLPVFAVRVENGFAYVSERPTSGELPEYASSSGDEGGEVGTTGKGRKDGGSAAAAAEKAAVLGAALLAAAAGGNSEGGEDGDSPSSPPSSSSAVALPVPPLATAVHLHQRTLLVDGVSWVPAALQSVTKHSADTNVYRFAPVPGTPAPAFGPVPCDPSSWHVSLRQSLDARAVSREYTPVSALGAWIAAAAAAAAAGAASPAASSASASPFIDLLVKIYPTGLLTSRLGQAKVGDVWHISAPETTLTLPSMLPPQSGGSSVNNFEGAESAREGGGSKRPRKTISIEYAAEAGETGSAAGGGGSTSGTGAGAGAAPVPPEAPVASARLPASVGGPGSAVLLVAGGTGITPVLQLARWCLGPSGAVDRVYVLTSNKTADDVLCRSETARLGKGVRTLHTLTRQAALPALLPEEEGADGSGSARVRFGSGRVSVSTVRSLLADLPPAALQRVVVSGPRGFFETVRDALVGAGYSSEGIVELEA